MTQYIDKSALVAEIERRIKKYAAIDVCHVEHLEALYGAKCKALMEILSFLDTLETKEEKVDLEKEIYDAEKRFGDIDEMGGYRILIFDDEFRDILHYFFELGIKAKGE